MPTEKHSFEENLKELETVVRSLESGNVSLDEMLGLFERGVALTKECTKQLDSTEQKINILIKKADGLVAGEPFETAIPGDLK